MFSRRTRVAFVPGAAAVSMCPASARRDGQQVYIRDRGSWRSWLDARASSSSGIWLVHDKGPARQLSYDDIVEEALCFGWIDSLPRALDPDRAMLWLSPRNPSSRWSRVNKQRVERLVSQGLMSPSGIAVVAAAQASGAWTALDGVEDLVEPEALREALDASARAREAWEQFPRSVKRGILEWIVSAKKDTTRNDRIARTVSEAEQGRRANQWRPPGNRRWRGWAPKAIAAGGNVPKARRRSFPRSSLRSVKAARPWWSASPGSSGQGADGVRARTPPRTGVRGTARLRAPEESGRHHGVPPSIALR